MSQLSSLICPGCQGPIGAIECERIPVATGFEDCLRRCEPCGIGASNATRRQAVTYIYRDPLKNIPIESREGATNALDQAANGTEFTSNAILAWARDHGVEWHYIAPGTAGTL